MLLRLYSSSHDTRRATLNGRARLVCFVAVLVPWLALAQSEAPVVWGEARSLGIGAARADALLGDTLVLAGEITHPEDPMRFAPVWCTSYDNGLTVSPWQRLDTTWYVSFEVGLSGNAGRTVLFFTGTWDVGGHWEGATWIRVSTDAGQSWGAPTAYDDSAALTLGLIQGLQIVATRRIQASDARLYTVAIVSTDGGESWSAPVEMDSAGVPVAEDGLVATRQHLLVFTYSYPPGLGPQLIYSRGERSGLSWTPWQPLRDPPPAWTTGGWSSAADTTSDTAVVVLEPGWDTGYVDIAACRTTDGGASWLPPQPLTTGEPVIGFWNRPELFCRGQLYGAFWAEGRTPAAAGIYCRLSANHGKSWYPAQRVDSAGDRILDGGGQFVGRELRLYYNVVEEVGLPYEYRTVTGLLTPDTLAPTLSVELVLPDTLGPGDEVTFRLYPVEDDTLHELRVFIADSLGSVDTLAVTWTAEQGYQARWEVPAAGSYRYRATAEDFWEHVGCYPDTGWASFATGPQAAGEPRALPASFALSCFPNPFNSQATLRFALPVPSEVKLTLYDVTGRAVLARELGRLAAGEHAERIEAEGLASGIYFARMQVEERSVVRKVALVR